MIEEEVSAFQPELNEFIDRALWEDVRGGDHSSLACIPADKQGKAKLLVKDDGILAGMVLAEYIFHYAGKDMRFTGFLKDGQQIKKGDIAFEIEGPIQQILKLERLVLNCMQRMSGIATQTHEMTSLIADLPTKLLDTRKSTPGMRFLEKWAVRIGGGHNHRFGLFDMIMLKDNHVDGAGGIEHAIKATHEYMKKNNLDLPIVIETRNLEEVKQVLAIGGVNRIMLDNFEMPAIKEAVALINRRYETELSGGVTKNNLRDYALTGVDFISTSATIHSVKSLDLSLKLVK